MRFNMNEYARVKLNSGGIKILKNNHEELAKHWPSIGPFKLKLENGWYKAQLWSIMQVFGPHIDAGAIPPFETEIELIEHDD